MKIRTARTVFRRIKMFASRNPDRFLARISGVIHVGAHAGEERDQYAKLGLRVIWIEPIPEVFERLQANIAGYPDQRAIQSLITDGTVSNTHSTSQITM